MPKKHQIRVDSLTRLLIYILGHNPDEFGLVPDHDGYVSYKELIQAIHEEQGWGYVRRGHIREILLSNDRVCFEYDEERIRARERTWHLDVEPSPGDLPKILFIAVRRRAHPHVMEKGLRSIQGRYLPLSQDEAMALRIGRRRDQKPVMIEVRAHQAKKEGVLFIPFGQLFLATDIPAEYVSGPPVPKEVLKTPEPESDIQRHKILDFQAGTFLLDPDRDPAPHRRQKGKKKKGWKEDARKLRRR